MLSIMLLSYHAVTYYHNVELGGVLLCIATVFAAGKHGFDGGAYRVQCVHAVGRFAIVSVHIGMRDQRDLAGEAGIGAPQLPLIVIGRLGGGARVAKGCSA